MKKSKINKNKIVIYVSSIVIAVSLYFNFHLNKQNQQFKIRIGANYQATVEKTLFRLNEDDVEFWIETLQKEENGDVRLERHIGNLDEIIQGYDDMNGKVGIIGMQIDYITRQYRELEKSLEEGKDSKVYEESIRQHIKFIRNVLKQLQSDLGQNDILWYKELSGFETKTGKYVWEEFSAFQNNNKSMQIK